MAITDKTTLSLTLRPKAFDDVIGLEKPVRIIKNKLAKGEVPRAILIRGTYGCGKTTLAHIIALAVQKVADPFFEGVPDVEEVNGAHYRKIEHMRALADRTGSYPMQGTYKVIILDECHKVTSDAQDILLKELEVPKSPTVWILCTTDPEDMNQGVLDRCFKLDVEGMDAAQRHELITRAAEKTKYDGDLTEFEALITKAVIVSPRKILQAFEQVANGSNAEDAVNSQMLSVTPEYHDIAFATVFGKWDSDITLWGKVPVKSVGQLLRDLEDRLSKKSKSTSEEESTTVDDADIADSKPAAARALRAVLGAFLKGRVLPKALKNGSYKFPPQADSDRAYKAMHVLANTIPASAFELQWSGVIATLYRVNQIMQGK